MSSLMERSLKVLRERGYLAKKAEHWNSWSHKREDFWGFDAIAVNADHVLFVQITDDAHLAEHRKKLAEMETTPRIVECKGARSVIFHWGKHGARGKRKLWGLREESVGG